MPDAPDPAVRESSQLTTGRCVQCGEQKVIQIYERFASRVLFCIACEHVWTNEPGGYGPGERSGST